MEIVLQNPKSILLAILILVAGIITAYINSQPQIIEKIEKVNYSTGTTKETITKYR